MNIDILIVMQALKTSGEKHNQVSELVWTPKHEDEYKTKRSM